jgi:hypothetical protein
MKVPNREQQRQIVKLWEATGRELERIRRDALRGMPYNWKDVDALLQLGDSYDGPPRTSSGLIEMQRLFMKLAPSPADSSGAQKESPDDHRPPGE